MQPSELVAILDQLRERIVDFSQAVAAAHERAALRALDRTARELRWLTIVAHEMAEDAWQRSLSALQDQLAGLSSSLPPDGLNLQRLVEQARSYWQGAGFGEATADLLTRCGRDAEDLQALGQAFRLLVEELSEVVPRLQPASEAGGTGGEAR